VDKGSPVQVLVPDPWHCPEPNEDDDQSRTPDPPGLLFTLLFLAPCRAPPHSRSDRGSNHSLSFGDSICLWELDDDEQSNPESLSCGRLTLG